MCMPETVLKMRPSQVVELLGKHQILGLSGQSVVLVDRGKNEQIHFRQVKSTQNEHDNSPTTKTGWNTH